MSHLHRLLLTVGLLVVMTRPAAANNYVVTNNADFGAGSLRKAINDANANAGADTITFMLPAGSTTITPQSPLPVITAGGLEGEMATDVELAIAFEPVVAAAVDVGDVVPDPPQRGVAGVGQQPEQAVIGPLASLLQR